MKISILTIFEEYFTPLNLSLFGKAIKNAIVELNVVNLRKYASEPHFNVDDSPYGGGAGMVMRFDILQKAVDDIIQNSFDSKTGYEGLKIIFTCASGKKFTQSLAKKYANLYNDKTDSNAHLVFICGRFEGYDQRIVEYCQNKYYGCVDEISIGNYVLFGGECAVLVMCEAIVRLLPNVLGNPQSLEEESYSIKDDSQSYSNLIGEYPQYTRPENHLDYYVPDVLLSGNHKLINQWRKSHQKIIKE